MLTSRAAEPGLPVKPGDTLVISKPFVFSIQPHFRNKVCENCLNFHSEWGGIELCSKCSMVGYCSPACKLQHDDQHRLECELFQLRKKRAWPHRAIFLARAVLKVQSEGYDELEKINEINFRSFGEMMDHYDDITTTKTEEELWIKEVGDLLGSLMPEREEYIRIYGRLLVNSFALRILDNKGDEENVGTVLYRAASIFDHSCQPNATTVFGPGGQIEIKSMIHQDKLDLSQFFISYLDESDARNARRSKLKKTWYFDCICPNCSSDRLERLKHGAKCTTKGCSGEACVDVQTWNWFACSKCKQHLDEKQRAKYEETYSVVRDVIDDNGGECSFTDVGEFLVRQMETVFHQLDIDLIQAATCAAQGNYNTKEWKKALHYYSIALSGTRTYYQENSGYLGPVMQRLAECYFHTGQLHEARQCIQEARELMEVVPGKETEFFKSFFVPLYEKIMKE